MVQTTVCVLVVPPGIAGALWVVFEIHVYIQIFAFFPSKTKFEGKRSSFLSELFHSPTAQLAACISQTYFNKLNDLSEALCLYLSCSGGVTNVQGPTPPSCQFITKGPAPKTGWDSAGSHS